MSAGDVTVVSVCEQPMPASPWQRLNPQTVRRARVHCAGFKYDVTVADKWESVMDADTWAELRRCPRRERIVAAVRGASLT